MRILPFVALVLLPAAAVAQNAPIRQGFGISFGIGSGSAGATCTGCSSDRDNGTSGYLRLGGHISPSLFLGGESAGWVRSENGTDQQIGSLAAVAQWYPAVQMGWYMKGGLGMSSYSAKDATDEITSTSGVISLGGGYDWRVGKNFSLTPYVNYLKAMDADMKTNGTSSGFNMGTNVFQLGLGFTWH